MSKMTIIDARKQTNKNSTAHSAPKVQVANIHTTYKYLLSGIHYLENDEQLFIFFLPIRNHDKIDHVMKQTSPV